MQSDCKYILDSGTHPSNVCSAPPNSQPLATPKSPTTANSSSLPFQMMDKINLKTDQGLNISLPAYVSKHVQNNHLSVHSIAQRYSWVLFGQRHSFLIRSKPHLKIIGTASWTPHGYKLNRLSMAANVRTFQSNKPSPISVQKPTPLKPTRRFKAKSDPKQPTSPVAKPPPNSHPNPPSDFITRTFHQWHLRYNNIDPSILQKMAKRNLLDVCSVLKNPLPKLTCSGCWHARIARQPYRQALHHHKAGESIFSDTCGPFPTPSNHCNRYFSIFIETRTRFVIAVYTEDSKQTFKLIATVLAFSKANSGRAPLVFTSDNAEKFTSAATPEVPQSYVVMHKPSTAYSPRENSLPSA